MKIITITDSPNINSGLARVHRNVINGLIDAGHEVIPCVWFGYSKADMDLIKKGEKPDNIYYEYKDKKIQMYCLPKGKGDHVMFATCDAISSLAPDIVFTLGDYWSFFFMKAIKTKLDYSFKWIFYPTVEETIIDPKWKTLFSACDRIVSPTEFGAEAIRKLGFEVSVVPYGTGPEFYRKSVEEILELRKRDNIQNKFQFMLVAQNTYRKNLPSVLLALKEIKEHYPKDYERISVYIHTNIMNPSPEELYVYDLISIAEQLDVCEAITFPIKNCSIVRGNAISDNALAEMYNMADYMIVPSSCEGYALPMMEAMACGLPVIGATNTAVEEHLKGSGTEILKIKTKKEIFPPEKIVDAIDYKDLADQMVRAVRGYYVRAELSARVEKYAKSKTWEGMQAGLLEIVDEVPNAVTIPVEVL